MNSQNMLDALMNNTNRMIYFKDLEGRYTFVNREWLAATGLSEHHALGLHPDQIVFVSSNSWDALGAAWYGYTTLWVNRAGLPFEELGTQPTRTASTLDAVLEFFPA